MPHPETTRIDRIIDIARGVAPVGPGERENREATRIPYASHIALLQISASGTKAPPIILPSENISSGGLCVISKLELPVGGRGAILMQKSDGECVLLGARVVYVNALGPKTAPNRPRPGGVEAELLRGTTRTTTLGVPPMAALERIMDAWAAPPEGLRSMGPVCEPCRERHRRRATYAALRAASGHRAGRPEGP
jgi:hypothetical protein